MSFELANKGVDREIIESALPSDDSVTALILAQNKANKYTDREKMTRYLLGRGYEYDVARAVAREVIDDND